MRRASLQAIRSRVPRLAQTCGSTDEQRLVVHWMNPYDNCLKGGYDLARPRIQASGCRSRSHGQTRSAAESCGLLLVAQELEGVSAVWSSAVFVTAKNFRGRVVDQNSASWNRLTSWSRDLDGLRVQSA